MMSGRQDVGGERGKKKEESKKKRKKREDGVIFSLYRTYFSDQKESDTHNNSFAEMFHGPIFES